MSISRAKNTIRGLLNEDGVRVEDPAAIKDLTVNFYQKLLGHSPAKLIDVKL